MVCLEFEWRSAFRVLIPQMAPGLKMYLEDVCSKHLQQEEQTRSSTSSHIPLACVAFRQEVEPCLETDLPKMIAEVKFHLCVCDVKPGCISICNRCEVSSGITAKLSRAQ